jgi:acetyl esterase/lipase
VSAVFHVSPVLPPTLIAAGEHDYLVPFAGHREIVKNFDLAGVSNVLVAVPYSTHAYDFAWGSLLGAQISSMKGVKKKHLTCGRSFVAVQPTSFEQDGSRLPHRDLGALRAVA